MESLLTALRRVASARSELPARTRTVGWVLLPLRAFLGITFTFAGLQKLADRNFFDPHAPTSVQSQLAGAARHSPVSGLLHASGHHAVLVGLLIAFGELAVGLGALLGLWTRAAAIGGMALSLGFLLAVSWHSQPYYLGPDIVFLVAWTPLALAGSGGILSLDGRLRRKAGRDLRLAPRGEVSIEFAAVRRLCGAFVDGRCDVRDGRPCGPAACPVLLRPPTLKPAVSAELSRRTFMRQAGAAGVVALGAGTVAAIVAAAGRLASSGTRTSVGTAESKPNQPGASAAAPARPSTTVPTRQTVTPRPTAPPTTLPPGTPVLPASAVPVGGAARFRDPATHALAYVVQPEPGRFAAFSGLCTHNGCGVQYSPADDAFLCPCHGAAFDGRTGAVLQGPARRPLPRIAVAEGGDGQLYVQG